MKNLACTEGKIPLKMEQVIRSDCRRSTLQWPWSLEQVSAQFCLGKGHETCTCRSRFHTNSKFLCRVMLAFDASWWQSPMWEAIAHIVQSETHAPSRHEGVFLNDLSWTLTIASHRKWLLYCWRPWAHLELTHQGKCLCSRSWRLRSLPVASALLIKHSIMSFGVGWDEMPSVRWLPQQVVSFDSGQCSDKHPLSYILPWRPSLSTEYFEASLIKPNAWKDLSCGLRSARGEVCFLSQRWMWLEKLASKLQ